MIIPFHSRWIPAVSLVLVLGACSDSPLGDDDDEVDPTPPNPSSTVVLKDVTRTLAASELDFDTFTVTVPEGHVLGVIFESEDPLHMQWGPRSWREMVLTPGGTFAAVIDDVEGDDVLLRVRHGDWSNIRELEYRMRVVALKQVPEQTEAQIDVGALIGEWIDPPLDVDVFSFRLEAGERFFVESESEDDQGVTIRVQTPGGAGYVAQVQSRAERTSSEVFEADESGNHLLIVTNAGLKPDIANRYQVRVVRETEAE